MKYLVSGRRIQESPSPPSRGAWIEIFLRVEARQLINVAPLAGGVD